MYSMGKQDNIYEEGNLSGLPFSFNQEVTEVFEDMIDRSVPGYKTSLKLIAQFSKKYYQANTNCYDIGCSLGASSTAIISGANNAKVIAIDNSEAMITECNNRYGDLVADESIRFLQDDVCKSKLENASVICINYVIQFLKLTERDKLIKKAFEALLPGGVLLISEKVHFTNKFQSRRLFQLHHSFKSANGYSDLEIAGKRDSLEGVLHTETQEVHINRAISAGFSSAEKVLSNINFVTYKFVK